jgi:hypothetical protein
MREPGGRKCFPDRACLAQDLLLGTKTDRFGFPVNHEGHHAFLGPAGSDVWHDAPPGAPAGLVPGAAVAGEGSRLLEGGCGLLRTRHTRPQATLSHTRTAQGAAHDRLLLPHGLYPSACSRGTAGGRHLGTTARCRGRSSGRSRRVHPEHRRRSPIFSFAPSPLHLAVLDGTGDRLLPDALCALPAGPIRPRWAIRLCQTPIHGEMRAASLLALLVCGAKGDALNCM